MEQHPPTNWLCPKKRSLGRREAEGPRAHHVASQSRNIKKEMDQREMKRNGSGRSRTSRLCDKAACFARECLIQGATDPLKLKWKTSSKLRRPMKIGVTVVVSAFKCRKSFQSARFQVFFLCQQTKKGVAWALLGA